MKRDSLQSAADDRNRVRVRVRVRPRWLLLAGPL